MQHLVHETNTLMTFAVSPECRMLLDMPCNTFLTTLDGRDNDSLSPLSRLIKPTLSRWKIFNEEVDIVYFQFQPLQVTWGTNWSLTIIFLITRPIFSLATVDGEENCSGGGFNMIIVILASAPVVIMTIQSQIEYFLSLNPKNFSSR